MELPRWLSERVHFTNLERCGGRSVRIHAHWFARSFPCARLAVAALRVLLVLNTAFVPKCGCRTWGVGWFRAARRGPGSPSNLSIDDVAGR